MTDNMQKIVEIRDWVREELDSCVDFWLKYGIDRVNGGCYTCLDRTGKIYSTDKSVWMQGRCGWTFSYLCHLYGVKQEWLEAAKSCIDFLEDHCINHEAGDRLYFTVTAEGKPLRQRPQPLIPGSDGVSFPVLLRCKENHRAGAASGSEY